MSKEQQLTWDQIPEGLQKFMLDYYPFTDNENREVLATVIMQAIKPIVEKAYNDGAWGNFGSSEDYWNTLTTKDR